MRSGVRRERKDGKRCVGGVPEGREACVKAGRGERVGPDERACFAPGVRSVREVGAIFR